MNKENNELKPCPFCGKEAELKVSKHIPSGTDYTPRCTDPSCCGRLSKKYSTKELALHKWNKRMPQVVRCENCKIGFKKFVKGKEVIECQRHAYDDPRQYKHLDDYCSYGVSKEGAENG